MCAVSSYELEILNMKDQTLLGEQSPSETTCIPVLQGSLQLLSKVQLRKPSHFLQCLNKISGNIKAHGCHGRREKLNHVACDHFHCKGASDLWLKTVFRAEEMD